MRFIRRTLYNLKRTYGMPLSIYRFEDQELNYATGVKSFNKVKYDVDRAIVLPSVLSKKTDYGGINSLFHMGGAFEIDNRYIVIDSQDIDIEPEMEDIVVFDKNKYSIKSIERLEFDTGYLIGLRQAEGIVPNDLIIQSVTNTLVFEMRVDYDT